MPMGENRILLIRMEGTNRNAQIAALPVTDLRNTFPRFRRFPLVYVKRLKQTMRRIYAHGHLTVFETGAALSGHQIHIVAHAIEMRRFSPYRLHTVSTPEYRLARSRRTPIIDKGPGLRIDASSPDLSLSLPLRVDRRAGLGPVHIAVLILEYGLDRCLRRPRSRTAHAKVRRSSPTQERSCLPPPGPHPIRPGSILPRWLCVH